jgi:hypothetical protein
LSFVALTAAYPSSAADIYLEYFRGGVRCHQNCRAQRPWRDCPVVNCPPAVRDGTCGEPNCMLPGNRHRLHPARDPNWYYQCVPLDALGNFGAVLRPCACGTLFSAIVSERRCVHPEDWIADCPAIQPRNPILSEQFCDPDDCETCDDGGVQNPPGPTPSPPGPTPPPPAPTPPPPAPTPPGNNCPCTCVCIWFPCQPCPSNCPCNGQQQG